MLADGSSAEMHTEMKTKGRRPDLEAGEDGSLHPAHPLLVKRHQTPGPAHRVCAQAPSMGRQSCLWFRQTVAIKPGRAVGIA